MANALGFVKPKYAGTASKRTIGAARVQEVDGKVKISYLPKDDWKKKDGSKIEVTFPDGKVCNIFEMSQLSVNLDEGFDEILVVTSEEDKGVTQFSPYEGQFKCQFVELGHPNGAGTPAIWTESEPKSWSDKNGTKTYTTLDFRAYYKIMPEQAFEGVVLVHFLRYMFTVDSNNKAATSFELLSPSRAKKSSNGQKLLDCMIAGGAFDKAIDWPEDGNILPELERRLQQNNKPVMITVKDGWITDVSADQSTKKIGMSVAKPVEESPKVEAGVPLNHDDM